MSAALTLGGSPHPGWIRAGCLLLAVAAAGRVGAAQLLLMRTPVGPAYAEVVEGLRETLPADTQLRTIAGREDARSLAPSALVIAVGAAAGLQVAETFEDERPLLSLLVTEHSYRQIRQAVAAARARPLTAVFIQQPLRRQVELARSMFPTLQRFGVLYRPSAASEYEFDPTLPLVYRDYGRDGNLLVGLRTLLPALDGLMAVPDPEIYNSDTIHGILLTAFRLNKPVIGYSKPYVAAGALLSAYTRPRSIGEQAGRLVGRWLAEGRLPAPEFPQRFSVAVNQRVARALGLRPTVVPSPDAEFSSVEQIR